MDAATFIAQSLAQAQLRLARRLGAAAAVVAIVAILLTSTSTPPGRLVAPAAAAGPTWHLGHVTDPGAVRDKIDAAFQWDDRTQAFRAFRPGGPDVVNGTQLGTGLYWLRLTAPLEPTDVLQPSMPTLPLPEDFRLRLFAGFNVVIWLGAPVDPATLDLAGITAISRFNNDTQTFDTFTEGAPARGQTLRLIQPNDTLYLRAPAPRSVALPAARHIPIAVVEDTTFAPQVVFDYFSEVIGSENGAIDFLRLWPRDAPIPIAISGGATITELARLDNAIQTITADIGYTYEYVNEFSDTGIDAHLAIPHAEFGPLLPGIDAEFIAGIAGGAQIFDHNGFNQKALVVATRESPITGELYSTRIRYHIMLEEFVHALSGLGNSTDTYPGSLFASNPNDLAQVVPPIDRAVFQILRQPGIASGMTAPAVETVLQQNGYFDHPIVIRERSVVVPPLDEILGGINVPPGPA